MSEALEKIDRGALAALMSPEEIEAFNNDFSAGVTGDFLPQLSLRGGKWRIKMDGVEEVIQDERGPILEIECHLLGSRPCVSKSYYAGNYDPNKDQKGPDCSSTDGQYPDGNIQNPVAQTCQTCDNNAWGSRGEGSKGKLCSDFKQIAVSLSIAPDTALALRIPPTSFKPFASYISKLKMANIPAIAAVTKMKLVGDEYPIIEFGYGSLVDREVFGTLKETAASIEVQNLVTIQPRRAPTPTPQIEKVSAQQPVVVEAPAPEPAPVARSLKDLLGKKDEKPKATRKKMVVEEGEPVAEVVPAYVLEPAAETSDAAAKLGALLAKMKG